MDNNTEIFNYEMFFFFLYKPCIFRAIFISAAFQNGGCRRKLKVFSLTGVKASRDVILAMASEWLISIHHIIRIMDWQQALLFAHRLNITKFELKMLANRSEEQIGDNWIVRRRLNWIMPIQLSGVSLNLWKENKQDSQKLIATESQKNYQSFTFCITRSCFLRLNLCYM